MASKNGACGCCSRRALIIGFAFCGVVLLTLGLVFSVGGVFSNLVKVKVDQVSYQDHFKITGKISYPRSRFNISLCSRESVRIIILRQ